MRDRSKGLSRFFCSNADGRELNLFQGQDDRRGLAAAITTCLMVVLLVAAWLLGGPTRDSSWHDEGLQLLSLPVLVMAVAALLRMPPRTPMARAALAVMLAAFAVVAMQLLPLPASLWMASPPRAALARDLATAGVTAFPHRWTLTPYGTEEALWRLLPPFAAFLAGLVVARRFRRPFLVLIVLLTMANLGFALQQNGLPQNSPLRLYPVMDGVPMFGGIFVNQNHFAAALVIAMALSLCLAVDFWRRRVLGTRKRELQALACTGLGMACLFAVHLTSSRAGMALLVPVLAGCLLISGLVRMDWLVQRTWLMWALVALVAITAGVSLHWMAGIPGQDPRFIIADATFKLGLSWLPWGSGAGSLTPVFESRLPESLWIPNFVNHAHNEFAQWWLTGGLPGMIVVLAGVGVFVAAGIRLLQVRGRRSASLVASGCWMAIAATLVHSWVDFPLGTLTLATTVGLLAGLLFASLEDMAPQDDRQVAVARSRTSPTDAANQLSQQAG